MFVSYWQEFITKVEIRSIEWIVMVHMFLFSFIHWWLIICGEADVFYSKHAISILEILNETTIYLSQHIYSSGRD